MLILICKRFILLFIIGLIILSLAGCGQASSGSSAPEHVHEGMENQNVKPDGNKTEQKDNNVEETVVIKDGQFQPPHLSIKAGTTVVWLNQDTIAHEVHAEDDSFHSPRLEPGQSFSLSLKATSNINYHCHLHPNEHGMIMAN